MHRFYLPPEQWAEPVLCLVDREAHHASHVLRLRPGEHVLVLDGAGNQSICEVLELKRERVTLRTLRKSFAPRLPFRITLLQALPRGKIIESIIQKATELEVYRVVPLLSERATPRLDADGTAQKLEKWRLTAIEAVKQCGSPWLPVIEPPCTPNEFLAREEKFDLPLIASLQPGTGLLRDYLKAFQAAQRRAPESACVWIGPEGDFSPQEITAIQAQGALPISLGRSVLRSETAAISALSILGYELRSIA